MKKTNVKRNATTGAFVVGTKLPERLPKAAREVLENGTTPARTFEFVAKISKIKVKSNVKHAVC